MFKKLILLCSLIANCALAYAGLTINPSKAEIVVPPGQSYEAKFTVRNDYSSPTSVKVEAKNWFLLPDDKQVAVSSWLAVLDQELQLQPAESKEIRYQVTLSTDARGVRTGMVSFIPSTEEQQGLSLVISAAVFVTAAGTEKVDWKLVDAKITKWQDQVQVSAQVKNSGNIHIRPEGTVQILSKDKEVAILKFHEGRPIYPGAERTIVATMDKTVVLPKGKYSAVLTVNGAGQEKKQTIKFKVKQSGEIIKK